MVLTYSCSDGLCGTCRINRVLRSGSWLFWAIIVAIIVVIITQLLGPSVRFELVGHPSYKCMTPALIEEDLSGKF